MTKVALNATQEQVAESHKITSELAQQVATKQQLLQDIIEIKDKPTDLEQRIMQELQETKRQKQKYEEQLSARDTHGQASPTPKTQLVDLEENAKILEAIAKINSQQ